MILCYFQKVRMYKKKFIFTDYLVFFMRFWETMFFSFIVFLFKSLIFLMILCVFDKKYFL
jgi:hypothetical protein